MNLPNLLNSVVIGNIDRANIASNTLPNYVFQYTSCISKSLKELHLHKTLHCWVRKTIYAPMQTRVCTLTNIFRTVTP